MVNNLGLRLEKCQSFSFELGLYSICIVVVSWFVINERIFNYIR